MTDSSPTSSPSLPFCFSLSSFNVLAASYSRPSIFPSSNPSHLTFSYRHPLTSTILFPSVSDPSPPYESHDILCLQEVDMYEEYWKSMLNHHGWDHIYVKRGSGRAANGPTTTTTNQQTKNNQQHHHHNNNHNNNTIHHNNNMISLDTSSDSTSTSNISPSTIPISSSSPLSPSPSPSPSPPPLKSDGLLICWRPLLFTPLCPPIIIDFDELAYNSKNDQHRLKFTRHNVGAYVYLVRRQEKNDGDNNDIIVVGNCHLYFNPLFEILKLRQTILLLHLLERDLRWRFVDNENDHENGEDDEQSEENILKRKMRRRRRKSPFSMDYPYSTNVQFSNDMTTNLISNNKNDTQMIFSPPHWTDIPIFLCGDFNSTPASITYSFLTTQQYNPIHSQHINTLNEVSSSPSLSSHQFITDVDLLKLAKLLRAMGYNVSHLGQRDKSSQTVENLFDIAKKEGRIILTKSKSLLSRRNCPPSTFFISSVETPEVAFSRVILHFGLQFSPANFHSRCTLCNGEVDKLSLEELNLSAPKDFPPPLLLGKDESGNFLEFYRCQQVDCKQIYWKGNGSKTAEQYIGNILAKVQTEREKREREKKEEKERGKGKGKGKEKEREKGNQNNHPTVTLNVTDSLSTDSLFSPSDDSERSLPNDLSLLAAKISETNGEDHDHENGNETLQGEQEMNRKQREQERERQRKEDEKDEKNLPLTDDSLPSLPLTRPILSPSLSSSSSSSLLLDPTDGISDLSLFTDPITHSFHLSSAAVLRHGKEPKFTNYTEKFVDTLDYVLVGFGEGKERGKGRGRKIDVERYECVWSKEVMERNESGMSSSSSPSPSPSSSSSSLSASDDASDDFPPKYSWLPCASWPSDHCQLSVKITLK